MAQHIVSKTPFRCVCAGDRKSVMKKDNVKKPHNSIIDEPSDDEFSLESILAEYKSDAFVSGDRQTPSETLDEQTEMILREVRGDAYVPPKSMSADRVDLSMFQSVPESQKTESTQSTDTEKIISTPSSSQSEAKASNYDQEKTQILNEEPLPQNLEPATGVQSERDTVRSRWQLAPPQVNEPTPPQTKPDKTPKRKLFERRKNKNKDDTYTETVSDDDTKHFGSIRFSKKPSADTYYDYDDSSDSEEDDEDEEKRGFSKLFNRERKGDDVLVPFDEEEDEELDMAVESEFYSEQLSLTRVQCIVSAVLCGVLLLVTLLYSFGVSLPFGIGRNGLTVLALSAVLELGVMALGMSVLVSGLEDIISLSPGVESLVFISCLVSVLDTIFILIRKDLSNGLSMALVSVLSLLGVMYARYEYCKTMRVCIDTVRQNKNVVSIVCDETAVSDKRILKKVSSLSDGFYSRLNQIDYGEEVYTRFAPIFIALTIVLSLIATAAMGRGEDFLHTLSILMAVSASFPAALVFVLPFKVVITRGKKYGSVISGWGGTCDIAESDGAIITDEDLFPSGTVALGGIGVFENVSERKAIVYTASIIIASGSGVSNAFAELLKKQRYDMLPVRGFSCYDSGGIGGTVNDEKVLIGMGAFMNLMGIRVPEDLNDKKNIFTAINGELVAMFSVEYTPTPSVKTALVALMNTHTNIYMAIRDFNVTPNMIRQKFGVSMEGVEYIPMNQVYKLSENATPKGSGASAVQTRKGLLPFAEIITRGTKLKIATELNTLISILSSAVMILMLFFVCLMDGYSSASAINIVIFMAIVAVAVFFVSMSVKKD